MKVLLIDDEPLARKEMRRLLKVFPWIEIAGEAANITEAEERIQTLAPDLLFLDIQMPGGSGFDLLDRLDRAPRVIFTTAFDQHAIRAFDVNALDYLLKPVDPARLAIALARIRITESEVRTSKDEPLDQIFVRDGSKCWFIPLREVHLIESDGNYVRLCWGKTQPLCCAPLSRSNPVLIRVTSSARTGGR